jgi:hypothetical protein
VIGGRVLDVTALRDLTIGRTVYGAAFVAAAVEVGIVLAVPASALLEAWAAARDEDYPFLELLLDLPLTVVAPLDEFTAAQSGAAARDAYADGRWSAAAAHAVQVAHSRGWPILTADPTPLLAVDPGVAIEPLPGPI